MSAPPPIGARSKAHPLQLLAAWQLNRKRMLKLCVEGLTQSPINY